MRTPVSTIRWVLRELDDREKSLANLNALTTARLAHLVVQVAHGMSGSKHPVKAKPQDFLPYPDWKPSSVEADGPDQPTKFILSELMRQRQIPMHVFVGLVTPVEKQP